MSSVDIACRCALVLVFLASANGKRENFGGFVAAIRLLHLVPERWPRTVARVVVGAEVVAAGLLLLPSGFAAAGFVLVILLCAVFAVVIEVSVRKDLRVACPCFGGSADLLNRRHLLRDGVLVVVAVVGLVGVDTGRPGFVEVLIGVVVAVFVAALVIRFDDVAEVLVPRTAVRR